MVPYMQSLISTLLNSWGYTEYLSPECSVCTASLLQHSVLPSLSSISSAEIVCWALSGFLLPDLCPENSLKAVSWGIHRTHLTYFLSLGHHCPSFIVWWAVSSKPLFHIFCLFFCFLRQVRKSFTCYPILAGNRSPLFSILFSVLKMFCDKYINQAGIFVKGKVVNRIFQTWVKLHLLLKHFRRLKFYISGVF